MRKIEIEIKEKKYVLEMNRNSIKWLESNGFSPADFDNKILTYSDLLWASLFVANHKEVSFEESLELLEECSKEYDTNEIIKFAIEEYTSFISALTDTNLNKNKKNKSIKIISD